MTNNLATTFQGIKTSCNLKGKINPFLIYFSGWMLLLLFFLLTTSKYDSFIQINHLRSYTGDIIFTFFTVLGNGIILIPITIVLLLRKRYPILIGLILTVLLTTLIVSLLKQTFNQPRPLACYDADTVLTASWIKLHTRNSFPSGHTASAFCIAAYLSFAYNRNRRLAVLSFFCAALAGYSRIYLGQHFLQDVWLGSLIGVFIAALSYVIVQYYSPRFIKGPKKQIDLIRTDEQPAAVDVPINILKP